MTANFDDGQIVVHHEERARGSIPFAQLFQAVLCIGQNRMNLLVENCRAAGKQGISING